MSFPAIKWDLYVQAGSWDPQYITLTDPDTREPLDLTAPGFSVHGVVATRTDGQGDILADLPDNSVWRRTTTGRLYFEPDPDLTSTWTFRRGFHQVEITHPVGQPVRIAAGLVLVSPELVT